MLIKINNPACLFITPEKPNKVKAIKKKKNYLNKNINFKSIIFTLST